MKITQRVEGHGTVFRPERRSDTQAGPQRHRMVGRPGSDACPVRAERDRPAGSLVPAEDEKPLAGGGVPQPHRPVLPR